MFNNSLWWITNDGDARAAELYERHYSKYHYKDGRQPKKIVGPGEYIMLRTWSGDALFVWRKFKDDSGQQGINCAIFRNESSHKSSELIRQADAIADFCWLVRGIIPMSMRARSSQLILDIVLRPPDGNNAE